MPHCIIVRGIPGSGKSTFAKTKFPNHIHINTDKFFEDGEGNYNFNPMKIGQAHAWAMGQFLVELSQGNDVVVDNTFTHKWEYSNYVLAAKLVNYKVKIFEIMPHNITHLQIAAGRNTHQVPTSVIGSMAVEFEFCEDACCFAMDTWEDLD